MRAEKEYLVREASDHLEKSTYFFLTDYKGINSEETSELRSKACRTRCRISCSQEFVT